MYLRILFYLIPIYFYFFTYSYSQEIIKEVDSLKINLLETIVVTGQYKPQSIDKSIYRVEVIDKIQIRNMAVNNVGDLLKQQLNIEIDNGTASGRSKIKVLGLDGQYTKILMDNIPIAGDLSMGSDVDLSTISLDDVERVEIVKGAMGVEYGTNSIAGVINIITTKTASDKTDIRVELKEETVRNEYNLKINEASKGKHTQSISVSRKIIDNLSARLSLSREKFSGYWGDYKGGGIINEPTAKRGYDWSPKVSWNGNLMLSYLADKFTVFYKLNYFNSYLTDYSHITFDFKIKDDPNNVLASINNDFKTLRWNHHFNIRGEFWEDANYNFDLSFQKNGLEKRRQAVNLQNNSIIDKENGIPGSKRLLATDWEIYNRSIGIYSKANIVKPLFSNKVKVYLGYELDDTNGYQGTTLFFGDVSLNKPIDKTLFTAALYASFEWDITPKILIRPGFRVDYNSQIKTFTNQAITTRYRFNDNNDLRLIMGTSTRFPNYDELYMSFVDNVHDYSGNPDLRPEIGQSVELQWTHHRDLFGDYYLETNISSMFQNIKDRIIMAILPGGDALTGRNTYINENNYMAWLNQLDIKFGSDKMQFTAGLSLLGNKGNDDSNIKEYSDFLWNTQINSQFTYVFPYDIHTSLFYRFVGKQSIYTFIGIVNKKSENEREKILNRTDSYNKLDLSVAKSFFNKKLNLSLGVNNIFDVTDIGYKPIDYSGTANVNMFLPRTQRLYYGRSYYVRLSYRI